MDILCDLYEKKGIYDANLLKHVDNLNINDLIKVIEKEKEPETDIEKLWLMKYNRNYDRKKILEIMLKNKCQTAIIIFSYVCSKEDKELYRDQFFSLSEVKNNENMYNYLKAKMIICDEINKKNKSKDDLLKALIHLNKVDENFAKSCYYYKYLCNYFLGNYDESLKNLLNFFKNIKYFNHEITEIYYEKLNIVKFYCEINKLENKNIFTSLIEKLNNDKTIKFINMKINKIDGQKNPCINCKVIDICIDYFNCNHLICLDCVNNKKCNFCKNKYIF